jgi:hypothetical protein
MPPVADIAAAEVDQQGQLDQIEPWLLENERLHAVYDCKGAGTGFVGITDKQLIFYDKAFAARRKAMVSIPFSKITSVSSIDEGRGWFGATSGQGWLRNPRIRVSRRGQGAASLQVHHGRVAPGRDRLKPCNSD